MKERNPHQAKWDSDQISNIRNTPKIQQDINFHQRECEHLNLYRFDDTHWFQSQHLSEDGCSACARARVCVFLCVIIVVPNTYVCLLTPFVFSACMINACGRTLYSVPNYTKHNKHKILLFNGQLEWMCCALPDFWRLWFQRMAFFALIFWLELSERIFSRVCALFCALFGHSFSPFHTGAELFHFISISFSHSGLVWRPMEAPIATNLVHSTFDIHTWSESLRKVLLHPAWTLPIFLPMLKCGQWMDLSADIWVVCLILMTLFFLHSTHLHIKFDNKFLCSDCWSVRGLD